MYRPKVNNWSKRQVTSTTLRKDLADVVKQVTNGQEVVVVTVDACPRLAILDIQQFEELCYQVDHRSANCDN